MALQPLDMANGIVLTIFCVISIFVGIRIVSRYFVIKRREFLLVGITWLCITSPWWPATISFIMFLITGHILTPIIYFLIGNIFVPIGLICWIIAFTDLVVNSMEKKKIIVIVFIIFGAAFYIIFFYFLFTDLSMIGQLKGYTDVQYSMIIVIFYLIVIIVALITGIIFSLKLFKSEKPELRLKGKFLLLAFIFFAIGVGMDTSIPLTFYTFPIYRTLEILSAFCFYCGFILPNWVKKFLLKEEKVENAIP